MLSEAIFGPGARAVTAPDRVPTPTKFFYALGQAPQAAGFDMALNYLFFFYSAVAGVPATWVGAALAVSLVMDAVLDPLIGSYSDAIRSRLGRRLPLMIAGVAPMAICMALLFAPPRSMSGGASFAWLALSLIGTRVAISIFNIPYFALGGELTQEYAERSSVVAWRTFAGVIAQVGLTVIGFSVFFGGHNGLREASAYPGFGLSTAAMISVMAALCILGVRGYVARLPEPAGERSSVARRLPAELKEVFLSPLFRALFISGVIFYVAFGVNQTLNNHALVYVWRLPPKTLPFVGYVFLLSVLAGITLSRPLLLRFEKRTLLLAGLGMFVGFGSLLPSLWLTGVFRPAGDAALGPLLAVNAVMGLGGGFGVVTTASMMADAADEHERLVGARREGLYFAGLAFANKTATGLGAMIAGVALDASHFPRAPAASAPDSALVGLLITQGPVAGAIGLLSMVALIPYTITRARHAQAVREIRATRALSTTPASPRPTPDQHTTSQTAPGGNS